MRMYMQRMYYVHKNGKAGLASFSVHTVQKITLLAHMAWVQLKYFWV